MGRILATLQRSHPELVSRQTDFCTISYSVWLASEWDCRGCRGPIPWRVGDGPGHRQSRRRRTPGQGVLRRLRMSLNNRRRLQYYEIISGEELVDLRWTASVRACVLRPW